MGYSGQKATLKLSRLTNYKTKRTSTELNDEPLITIPANLLARQQAIGPSPKKSASGSVSKKPQTNTSATKPSKPKHLRQSLSYATDDPEVSFSLDKEGYLIKKTGEFLLDHYGQKIRLADDTLESVRPSVKLAKKQKPEIMDSEKARISVRNLLTGSAGTQK